MPEEEAEPVAAWRLREPLSAFFLSFGSNDLDSLGKVVVVAVLSGVTPGELTGVGAAAAEGFES